jgi:hypothetical protein
LGGFGGLSKELYPHLSITVFIYSIFFLSLFNNHYPNRQQIAQSLAATGFPRRSSHAKLTAHKEQHLPTICSKATTKQFSVLIVFCFNNFLFLCHNGFPF